MTKAGRNGKSVVWDNCYKNGEFCMRCEYPFNSAPSALNSAALQLSTFHFPPDSYRVSTSQLFTFNYFSLFLQNCIIINEQSNYNISSRYLL